MPKHEPYNKQDLEDRRALEFEYERREEDDDLAESQTLAVSGNASEANVQAPSDPVAEAATDPEDDERNAVSTAGGSAAFRSIKDIVADLSKPISPRHIEQRKQGKSDIAYIGWYTATRYLDYFAPGWNYEVRKITVIGERLVLVCRITIPAAEGYFWREATGQESLDSDSYGDPSSNAEAMALKRAAAKFGLGLHLYLKDS